MKISDLMSKDPAVVRGESSLDEAIQAMEEADVRHLPVMEKGKLAGMLSERDLLEATGWLGKREREVLEIPNGVVRDHMKSPVVSVAPGDDLDDALDLLVAKKIGCVPVVEGGDLVGMLTEMDVLKAYAHACKTDRIGQDDDPTLAALMHSNVEWLGPAAGVEEAMELFERHGWRHLPVVEDGRLVGIVSDRDIRRERGSGQLELSTLDEVMMPSPITARPDERLSSAAHVLTAAKVSALPVVDGGQLVGIVTIVDLLTPCGDALAALAKA